MFEDDEWNAIIGKLMDLTRANKTAWHNSESQDLVSTVIGPVAYIVGSVDNDGRAPYFLAVVKVDSDANKELARLESTPVNTDEGYSPQEKIVDLHRLAFRMASGGPQLVASLLADMNALLPPTPAPDVWDTPNSRFNNETPF